MIGLGGIGQRHARNLRQILGGQADLIAYRVRHLSHIITPALEADSTKNVEDELDIEAYPNLDAALLQEPRIAFICNPTSLHIPTAMACVEAGCDLFIEKPLSHSVDGVCQLIEAVDRKQRIAMVGYQLRF